MINTATVLADYLKTHLRTMRLFLVNNIFTTPVWFRYCSSVDLQQDSTNYFGYSTILCITMFRIFTEKNKIRQTLLTVYATSIETVNNIAQLHLNFIVACDTLFLSFLLLELPYYYLCQSCYLISCWNMHIAHSTVNLKRFVLKASLHSKQQVPNEKLTLCNVLIFEL